MSPRLRTGVAGLAVLLLSLLALVVPTTQAQAASYRFWGFYDWADSAWAFSTENPTTSVPADGSVQGWRFALSGESGSPRVPRAEGDFDAICGAVTAEAGQKRVALVIDYGTAEDGGEGSEPPAARGACAVVAADATSVQALTEVGATTRIEAGLVCAIDSYPATGCGDATDDPAPTGSEAPVSLAGLAGASPAATSADATGADDDGVSPGVLAGIGVALAAAVALGIGATLQSRRSRQS